jgi:hypothetical protein
MSTATITNTEKILSLKTTTAPHEASQQPEQSSKAQPQGLAACGTGGYPVAGMPALEDPYAKRRWQLEHMAAAFRVFSRKGYTEGTAVHISVRDPVHPSTFWINPYVP